MYLIVGANGFLGSYIIKNVLSKTTDDVVAVARNIDKVTESSRIEWLSCDVADKSQVDMLIDKLKNKELKVVYLAAYHNPDLVEENPKLAWNINVTSLSYFLNKLENVKCFFYPSTDSVYGNSVDGYHYKEEDKLHPVNLYGRQKCAAESIVRWYGYNVVRYPFLIAPSVSPVKKHFYDKIVASLSNGDQVEMFADSYRSSMSFDTAASLLIDLIENYNQDIPSILNICGDEDLSKYDIGKMIANKIGADETLVVPISTECNSSIFKAERAQSTLMDNSALKRILGLDSIKCEI